MKMLGYFSRLDEAEQGIILRILQKSLRMKRSCWSDHCFDLLVRLRATGQFEDSTLDLFKNNNS